MENNLNRNQELTLYAKLEALLFVAPEPLTYGQLATVLGASASKVKSTLDELENNTNRKSRTRGIRLMRNQGKVQFTSAPEASDEIEHLLGLESVSRLSIPGLETLAIIAYKQPATKPQIDLIRGVNTEGVIKSLLYKGLIQIVGRSNSPGRPILYTTTVDFLRYFGLNSIDELPSVDLSDEMGDKIQEDKVILKG